MKVLHENLQRIKELSETVVPFSSTIKGDTIWDAEGILSAVMTPLSCSEEYSILQVDVEPGFVHQGHYHDQCEILILLSGDCVNIIDGIETKLEVNKPFIIPPNVTHKNIYKTQTRMLVITVPASADFPKMESR